VLPVLLLLTSFLSLIISQAQDRVDGEGLYLLLLLLLRVLHVRDRMRVRYLRGEILRGQLGAQQMRASHAIQGYGLEIGIPRLHLQIPELLVFQHGRILEKSGTAAQSLECQAADVAVSHPVQRKVEFLHAIEIVILQ